MAEWISTRKFSDGVKFEQRIEIMQKYKDEKWDLAKQFLGGRNKITKNGILISEKVKQQLDIDLFPMIFITATKGYMDAGCARFMMMDERGTNYLFGESTTKYIAKKAKLEETGGAGRMAGESFIDIVYKDKK